MISRRKYFSILLIFAAVFLLFQGIQVGRIYLGDPNVNTRIRLTGHTGAGARGPEVLPGAGEDAAGEPAVCFVGAQDSDLADLALEWAGYAGRKIRFTDKAPQPGEGADPYLILADADAAARDAELFGAFARRGTDVLIMELPSADKVAADEKLREILGISEVKSESARFEGIRLFGGFFLGGERIFLPVGKDEGRLDEGIAVVAPWYVVRAGTKTYLQGIVSDADKPEKNEDLPAVVWRNSSGKGGVYAVSGSYMHDRQIGLGILESVMYERSRYHLYPVVNAQLLSVANLPVLSNENGERFTEVYGSPLIRFEADVIVPRFSVLASRYGFRPTCFFSSKYDYNDPALPEVTDLNYYLTMLNEMEGELGLSSLYRGTPGLPEKLDLEAEQYRGMGCSYPVYSLFAEPGKAAELAGLLPGHPAWQSVHTLSLLPTRDLPLLGYLGDDLTVQQITGDAFSDTFSDELRLLGAETALGYVNTAFDMSRTFRPEISEDEWQNLSKKAFSTIMTYQAPFKAFDRVTAAEGDARLRSFLDLDWSVEAGEERADLTVRGDLGKVWFVLRTHGEEIASVTGGAYTKIEPGAWLIRPEEEHVVIALRSGLPFGGRAQ